MKKTKEFIEKMGLPSRDGYELKETEKRFPDGCQYRIEIPSTEGPGALKAVIEEGKKHGVPIHRVSQGSGIMLMTDNEIRDMLKLGRDEGMEVSLFVGPRASFDVGAQVKTPAGKNIALRLRGADQLAYGVEDVKRGVDLGLRGVLVADLGLLWILNEMKKAGELPSNLVIKISVQMGPANPASIKLVEGFGAGTYNIPTDLTVPMIAAIRQAISIPIDMYVEAPDHFGGFIRFYELRDLIRVGSPIYVKLGLANAPDIYPYGTHIEATATALSRERVRRAKIVLDMIRRTYPEATMSEVGAPDLAIPEI